MRIPVPNNKLVAFTLVGALLTAGVAGALALPGGGLAQFGEQSDAPGTAAPDASQQVASDTPTPNQDFTPAVQTQSGHEDDDHEEYGEDDEGEDHDEDDDHEEYGEDDEGEDHDEDE